MPKKHKVLGIDPSHTHTALYFGPGDWVSIKGKDLRGARRLNFFEKSLREACEGRGITRVVIEGYAFAARSQAHKIGELGGVLRNTLYDMGVTDIIEIPPSALKKWATGKGTADKPMMVKAANDREKSDIRITSHDVADAALLWASGSDNTFLRDKGCPLQECK